MTRAEKNEQRWHQASSRRLSPAKTIVIVLHYRGVDDTIACLRSILPQQHDAIKILLVDNGSTDRLRETLAAQAIAVETLRLATNQGWAGGNNAGINWARNHGATAICLLNNDTIVPPGTFDRLAQVSQNFGPCLLHPAIDYADTTQGTQLDPSHQIDATPMSGSKTLYSMHYAYGACLFIPMAVFDRLGLFDERFFLQLEEADFHERAQAAGIPSLCEVSVRIIHAESKSFGGRITPDKTYYIIRNSLLLAVKQARNRRAAIHYIRSAYWHFRGAAEAEGCTKWSTTLRWSLSSHPMALAVRQAMLDFLCLRFGQRPSRAVKV